MFKALFFFKHGNNFGKNGLSSNIIQATTTSNTNTNDVLADDDLPEIISVVSYDSYFNYFFLITIYIIIHNYSNLQLVIMER